MKHPGYLWIIIPIAVYAVFHHIWFFWWWWWKNRHGDTNPTYHD